MRLKLTQVLFGLWIASDDFVFPHTSAPSSSVSRHDIALGGHVRGHATIVQHKTGRPVEFDISEQPRDSLQNWLTVAPCAGSRARVANVSASRRLVLRTLDPERPFEIGPLNGRYARDCGR
jgi:hypothetical protein